MFIQDYDGNKTTFSSPKEALPEHAKIYIAAEFFGVPQLKAAAAQKFRDTCKDIVYSEAPQFLQAAKLIYTETLATDITFRNVIVELIVAGRPSLSEGISELIVELPELSRDCSVGLSVELEKERYTVESLKTRWYQFSKWKCTICNKIWAEKGSGGRCPLQGCPGGTRKI